MILYAKIESERGKAVEKTGNEFIKIQLTENREQKYQIDYHKDSLRVWSYATGKNVFDEHYCETCKKFYSNNDIDPCDIPF